MNTITVRILMFFLSVFILVTVFSQFILQASQDYVTETALIYSSAEKVTFQGVYIRNETILEHKVDGILSYPCNDGGKVANGSVVAYVYESENDIYINQRIEKLKEEVELLESAQNPGTTEVTTPAFISKLIDQQYQTIAVLIAENDLQTLAEERKKLQTLMGIYQIVINEETDFNSAIDELNTEIKELEHRKKQPIDTITADSTGYFISYIDGFEKELSPDRINTLTVGKIKEIINQSMEDTAEKSVGKIVDGYEWKMVGVVNAEQTSFYIGNEVTVKFASTPDTVTAVIEDIVKSDNPEESIIILSCDELTYDLVQRRVERVEIILNDHEGIKVPRKAIRFNKDNDKGVYVILGQRIMFKKIDSVYECDEYILSKITSDDEYVSIYDDIICEGEISDDLYVEETTVSESEDVNDEIVTEGIVTE